MLRDKILFIVPTRKRPSNVSRLAKAFSELQSGFADLMFVVDGDHPDEHDYCRASNGWPVTFQPWRGLSGTLNTQGKFFAEKYRWIGFIGDDHVPTTHGFDAHLYGALRAVGEHAIAYGPDGQPFDTVVPMNIMVTPRTPHPPLTWWVMDCQTIRLLGQMVPYVLSHTCVDDYVWQLGYQAGTLVYVPGAEMDHLHPLWNKAETDESYELSSEHNNRLADHRKWEEYQEVQLPRDVALVKQWRRNVYS